MYKYIKEKRKRPVEWPLPHPSQSTPPLFWRLFYALFVPVLLISFFAGEIPFENIWELKYIFHFTLFDLFKRFHPASFQKNLQEKHS